MNETNSHYVDKIDQLMIADPDYQQLLADYQHGEWDACQQKLDLLLARYPNAQRLLDFKSDLEVRLSLRTPAGEQSRARASKVLITLMWVVVILAVLFLGGRYLINQAVDAAQKNQTQYEQQVKDQTEQHLKNLESQARASIQSGKPEDALETLVELEAANPEFPGLDEIRQEAIDLMTLDAMYAQEIQSLEAGNYHDAYTNFKQIAEKDNLYRDVRFQIETIERQFEVEELLSTAGAAYDEKRWADSINTYEKVLLMEPSASTQEVKEEMLYSYLHSIIETLDQPEPSIEDLDKAGIYYKKALSLIPQDRRYIQERDNLQRLSIELLVTKYYQTARRILKDPNHSKSNVVKAVEFLSRALDLRPESTQIESDILNAQRYLSAFEAFNDLAWDNAITGLEEMKKYDASYPNGMVPALLYEAYTARGDRYFATGFYLDAEINYEAAELLAWEDKENPMRLFQTQISIGLTMGKLERYQDAVSYIEYALKTVDAANHLKDDKSFSDALANAKNLLSQAKYYEAFFAYQDVLNKMSGLYVDQEIIANGGDNLVYLAEAYGSTVSAISRRNGIEVLAFARGQVLHIPTLP